MKLPENFYARITVAGSTYSFKDEFRNDRFSADLKATDDRIMLTVSCEEPMTFEDISVEGDISIDSGDKLFLNGYQSWTDSYEHEPHEKMRGLHGIPGTLIEKYSFNSYGDYNFTEYQNKAGEFHGFTYGYMRNGDRYILIGSVNERNGYTIVRFTANRQKVTLSLECEGAVYQGRFNALDCVYYFGGENEVFDKWFRAMNIDPPRAGEICGYTSWYRHYQDITHDKLINDLEAISSADYADVFQIDDGYQTAVGDWLSIDENKFPEGIKRISDAAHEKGLRSGLWLAPFVCEYDSEIYREHRGWLLLDDNGRPIKAGCNWSGAYALDFYNPEVREYLKKVFTTVLTDWDFDLVKLDFLYAVSLIPQGGRSRAQVMFEAMEFLRELVGSKLILACGVPLAPAFGTVDYCRIGCDVGLDWNDNIIMQKTHRERVSTKNSVLNTIFRRQLNKRAFINDPDVYLLREEDISMSGCQKQALCMINHLFGGVFFTSDNVSTYSQKNKKTLHSAQLLRLADLKSVDIMNGEVDIDIELNEVPKGITLTADGKLKKRY